MVAVVNDPLRGCEVGEGSKVGSGHQAPSFHMICVLHLGLPSCLPTEELVPPEGWARCREALGALQRQTLAHGRRPRPLAL